MRPKSTRYLDIAGKTFNSWTVLHLIENTQGKNKSQLCRCKCACGQEKILRCLCVVSGVSKSCGGCINFKHGRKVTYTKTYKVWGAMKRRCEVPGSSRYKDYGGRGIAVCERWQSFENFYQDMGEQPVGMQIDRIDNHKGYFKENCRWTTNSENARNKRSTKNYTFLGQVCCIAEWAERLGVKEGSLGERFRKGWDTRRALTEFFT